MTNLPPTIETALTERFGKVKSVSATSGGMVNESAIVLTEKAGRIFVKWKRYAPAGMFECEAKGLNALREACPLAVPEVLFVSDATVEPAFLVLECLEVHPAHNPPLFAKRLAEGIAALHRNNPSPSRNYGLSYDNFLGSLHQVNDNACSWPHFYAANRLLPLLHLGEKNGWLNGKRRKKLDTVIANVGRWLEHPNCVPVLVHGDLWSGNYLVVGNHPALIDPAIYYADREVEIAYIELFGGFPARFSELYEEAYPLDDGYEDRRHLLQLYPLLVHLNHFGEEYGPPVDHVLARYG